MKKVIFWAIVSIIVGLFKGPVTGILCFCIGAAFFVAIAKLITEVDKKIHLLKSTRDLRRDSRNSIYGERSFWEDYRLIANGCGPVGAIPLTLIERREARLALIDQWLGDVQKAYPGEPVDWRWTRYDTDSEIILRIGEGFYVGDIEFYHESDPKYLDQPRVKRFRGHVEGTDTPFSLPGKNEVVVSDESIKKNIENAFKNDKDLIRAVAEAHDQCLTKGEGTIDTLPLDLDCAGSRKMKIFGAVCREFGGFTNTYIHRDGHTLLVDMDMDADPTSA